MRADELGELSDAAAVVATVGTTAIDVGRSGARRSPTRASAAGAWLHVDAAYAGTAMVCPELPLGVRGRRARRLAGRQRAQVDAHADGLLAVLVAAAGRSAARRSAWSPSTCARPTPRTRSSLSEYGPALGTAVPGAEAVGGAALPRAQRPQGAHPPRRRARVAVRALGGRGAGLGAVRAAPVLGRLLPARGRRRAQPRAAGARQRSRRDLHLPRRAGRELRAAAGRRTDANDRGGRPASRGTMLRREASQL